MYHSHILMVYDTDTPEMYQSGQNLVSDIFDKINFFAQMDS